MEPDRTTTPASEGGRRSRGGVILGVALVALLLFGAAGYFYSGYDSGRDANREISSAPQAPQASQDSRPTSEDVASRPAENAAPPSSPQQPAPAPPAAAEAPAAPAPNAPAMQGPQPPRESPAVQTQGPAGSAPAESAASPTPAPPADLREQPTSLPGEDIVFVQKPRVNIRSEPSINGRVVGSASKGQQFKAVRRAGNWVQVEGDTTGWISGRLLGPEKP
jgi:hypothetical protein